MTSDVFRRLLQSLIDTALDAGWHVPDVQGQLVVAEMSLDERCPERTYTDDDCPY